MARDFFQLILVPLIFTSNTRETINFLQEKHLLANSAKCDFCFEQMTFTKYSQSIDQFTWRCNKRACIKKGCKKSVRTGSFFLKSKISLNKWLHLMYLWCQQNSIQKTMLDTNLSEKTVIDVYSFFREICAQYLLREPIRLDGGSWSWSYIQRNDVINYHSKVGTIFFS